MITCIFSYSKQGDSMYKWIAHRGNNNHGYKENTKEGLLAAINTPYIAGIEFDIRKTKDNHLVIIHNSTILSQNKVGIIAHMTLKELEAYNLGTIEKPSKICTLKQLLSSIHTSKILLIEIKIENIEEIVYQTIRPYSHLNLYICSFSYSFVQKFKKQYPNYKVGLIMGKFINHNKDISKFDFIVTKDIHLPFQKEIFIWDIKYPDQVKEINSNNFIVTDQAYLLKEN